MNNPELPKRKNLRLEHYDYSQNGGYFVTICTHERSHVFGEITGTAVGANLCVRPWHTQSEGHHR